VKVPSIGALLVVSFYVGLFSDIHVTGQPVTLLVAGIPLALAIAIGETIKEGDV
jgi:hypothetical protein